MVVPEGICILDRAVFKNKNGNTLGFRDGIGHMVYRRIVNIVKFGNVI